MLVVAAVLASDDVSGCYHVAVTANVSDLLHQQQQGQKDRQFLDTSSDLGNGKTKHDPVCCVTLGKGYRAACRIEANYSSTKWSAVG